MYLKILEFFTRQALTQHIELIQTAIFKCHRARTRGIFLSDPDGQAQQVAQMGFDGPNIRIVARAGTFAFFGVCSRTSRK